MIGRIAGVLLEKNPPQILVEAAGVGYEIEVPMSTFYNLPAPGAQVTLLTHFVVREDAHLLYGFGSDAERLLLELKDKLGTDFAPGATVGRAKPATSDIFNALLGLGYSEKEAQGAVKLLPEGLSVSDGIRQALKLLARA